jgi:hypothetical protein
MPTGGGFADVGREYTNVKDFCPIFLRCIMDKRDYFYLVLLHENPFFYCLDPIWGHSLVSQIPTGGTTDVGMEYMNVIHLCPMLY